MTGQIATREVVRVQRAAGDGRGGAGRLVAAGPVRFRDLDCLECFRLDPGSCLWMKWPANLGESVEGATSLFGDDECVWPAEVL